MLDIRIVTGRLTREPEIKDLSDDLKLATFTLACDSDYKDADGNKKTEWIECKAWRGNAKFVESYLGKGRFVAVVGRVETEEWEDKNFTNADGETLTRRKQIITVDKIYPLDSKKDEGHDEEQPAQQNTRQNKPASTGKSGNKAGNKLPNW